MIDESELVSRSVMQHTEFVPPPKVPAGYRVLERPRPVDDDAYLWTALVWSEADNLVGLLLYGDDTAPSFVSASEAMTLLHSLIEWSAELLRHATPCSHERHQHFAHWQTTSEHRQQWCHRTWQAICEQADVHETRTMEKGVMLRD